MIAALTYGLILFLVVAVLLGTRAWLHEQLALFAPLHALPTDPPSSASATTEPSALVERTDNLITITNWPAAQERRRSRREAAQEAAQS